MQALEYYNRLESALRNATGVVELQTVWNFSPELEFSQDEALVKAELEALYQRKMSQYSHKEAPSEDFSGEMYQFTIKAWFAKQEGIIRTFEGVILRQTAKAVLVRGRVMSSPSSRCRCCGREINHPVSVKYGLGIICGQHYGVDPSGESVESIRRRLSTETVFEKWMPKAVIKEQLPLEE